ncbi:MAG: hypothetical protein JXR37_00730 [Kiritimatiellae bacterium]|nr:hypothetical protein [Kiritimatiellia bacterium]
MRHARIKPDYQDTYHHSYNRVAGDCRYFPLGEAEKQHFWTLVRRLAAYYVVDVVAVQVVSNHFHLVLRTPSEPPSDQETCRRYEAYYHGERTLKPGTPRCRQIAERLRDISYFMKDLEEQFSKWFNRTRPLPRRGSFWAGRFSNVVLEDGLAVWRCWRYVEMNSVRAGLARDPSEYPFCTLGCWQRRGRHPFGADVEGHLVASLGDLLGVRNLQDIRHRLQREFDRIAELEGRKTPRSVELAIEEGGGAAVFWMQDAERVPYWVTGLVIGSAEFVRTTVARAHSPPGFPARALVPAMDEDGNPAELYACKASRRTSV